MKVIKNKKRQQSRLERLENEAGIGRPDWAGSGNGKQKGKE